MLLNSQQRKAMEVPTEISVDLKEGEYIKDGMIYCEMCGEAKLIEAPWDAMKFVRVICSCEKKKRDEELERLRQKELAMRYETLQKQSLLGERYKDVEFENTVTGENKSFDVAFGRCKKYCDNFRACYDGGLGIYLYGNCGVGKTHLMACMVNSLIEKSEPAVITNFFEVSKEIRRTFSGGGSESDFISKLTSIPFLFIDDIGTERLQVNGEDTFIQERIYDIINTRYLKKKPTIFSSNLSFAELVEQKGMWQKTVDRIVEMSSAVLKIEGESHRVNIREKILPF